MQINITRDSVLGLGHSIISGVAIIQTVTRAVIDYVAINGFNYRDPNFVMGLLITGATALKAIDHFTRPTPETKAIPTVGG
jgi:hypothetical protein